MLAAIGQAGAAGYDTHAWQLTWTLSTFLDRQGHWHDMAAAGRAAVAAADRLAIPAVQAWARRVLARAYTRLGRFDDAGSQLRDALGLCHRSADLAGQADTHQCWRSCRGGGVTSPSALDHARQCLDLSRAVGDQGRQATALNRLGWFHALLGDYQVRHRHVCERALAFYQELGDLHGEANT